MAELTVSITMDSSQITEALGELTKIAEFLSPEEVQREIDGIRVVRSREPGTYLLLPAIGSRVAQEAQ